MGEDDEIVFERIKIFKIKAPQITVGYISKKESETKYASSFYNDKTCIQPLQYAL